VGQVIYLRKEYVEQYSDNRSNMAVQNLLAGLGSFLILYGLYRLVRDIQGR
jgi:hypothetical protein